MKTYTESANTVPIYDECDVLVVGGGSAGHSAALAAARAGAKKVIIMERYGYMGGDVTGGYVIMVPKLSWYDKAYVRGIQEEWFERMENIPNAVLGPGLDEIGCTDPALINAWRAIHGTVSESEPHRLVRAVYYEPNQLKIEMDKMLYEERERIKILYHCLGVKPIMENKQVKGVIFESKEGRQAVLAKSVIDATGDGDIFRQTGTPFRALADSNTRSNCTALVWRIGGVNWDAYVQWQKLNPEAARALTAGMSRIAGFTCAPLPSSDPRVCWVNNWQRDLDCAKIEDITLTEVRTRVTMREVLEYIRKVCPVGFRDAYIYDIAPQLGSRCSYRLQGEYIMTAKDFAFAPKFDDVIAWHSTICRINDCAPIEIPYRAILPREVDNLLCPGRHISADDVAIDWLTLIPQCVGTGQAAGVAAAVAAEQGVSVREVDIKRVQDVLAEQNVPLPRNSKTDPSYTECCEEHQYGLYTDLAKRAKEEGIDDYRQW